jgi:hypothetical protein
MASPRTWLRVLLLVVLLGLGLRAYHYLRDPSMWHDEAAAVVNVLEKSFGELLGPLYWAEAAPPLFLWLSRAVVLALGDSTYALRLVPFLASCASVVLLAWVAWRVLPPVPAIACTLLIAGSDRLLWHACEAKPYAIDAFLAVGLLALHQAGKGWRLEWLLLAQLILAPFLLWLSYPGAFLAGASLVVLLPEVYAARRWSAWLLYAGWTCAVFVAFFALLVGPARAQRCGPMEACWLTHFPPFANPWMVPVWTVASAIEVVRYCFMPLGSALTLFAVVGGVVWVRAGRGALVLLCALPLGLALVASFLRQYPFGASRLEVFAAPGLALLIGAGVPPVWHWLAARQRWATVGVVVLLLACLVPAVRGPWYRPDAQQAAGFVHAHLGEGEMIYGNKWEHLYYFREQGKRFVLVEHKDERPQPTGCRVSDLSEALPAGRCWVLFSNDVPGSRDTGQATWAARGRVVEHRTFPGTEVYLIEVPGPRGGAEEAEVTPTR